MQRRPVTLVMRRSDSDEWEPVEGAWVEWDGSSAEARLHVPGFGDQAVPVTRFSATSLEGIVTLGAGSESAAHN